MEFVHELEHAGDNIPEAIYHPSTSWNAIVHQYTKGTLKRVVLEMTMDNNFYIDCSIAFRSSDRATLKLCYAHRIGRVEHGAEATLEKRVSGILSRAIQTILDHPQVASLKHLYMEGSGTACNLELSTEAIGRLLGSVGPLEKLTLYSCDLRPYLDPFFDTPLFPKAIQPTSFPPIKELAIIFPVQSFYDKVYAAAIVKLARSQHAREVPIEHIVLSPTGSPPPVKYELLAFVNTVGMHHKPLLDEDES